MSNERKVLFLPLNTGPLQVSLEEASFLYLLYRTKIIMGVGNRGKSCTLHGGVEHMKYIYLYITIYFIYMLTDGRREIELIQC